MPTQKLETRATAETYNGLMIFTVSGLRLPELAGVNDVPVTYINIGIEKKGSPIEEAEVHGIIRREISRVDDTADQMWQDLQGEPVKEIIVGLFKPKGVINEKAMRMLEQDVRSSDKPLLVVSGHGGSIGGFLGLPSTVLKVGATDGPLVRVDDLLNKLLEKGQYCAVIFQLCGGKNWGDRYKGSTPIYGSTGVVRAHVNLGKVVRIQSNKMSIIEN
ncbi:MAG: hypothetical protein QY318_02025 [Candidatus Dojkabacteria bacterium]|nr:MAG: hypothetical protein QY318_02025 [Candidatus Dojkabacteria bacterium]